MRCTYRCVYSVPKTFAFAMRFCNWRVVGLECHFLFPTVTTNPYRFRSSPYSDFISLLCLVIVSAYAFFLPEQEGRWRNKKVHFLYHNDVIFILCPFFTLDVYDSLIFFWFYAGFFPGLFSAQIYMVPLIFFYLLCFRNVYAEIFFSSDLYHWLNICWILCVSKTFMLKYCCCCGLFWLL